MQLHRRGDNPKSKAGYASHESRGERPSRE